MRCIVYTALYRRWSKPDLTCSIYWYINPNTQERLRWGQQGCRLKLTVQANGCSSMIRAFKSADSPMEHQIFKPHNKAKRLRSLHVCLESEHLFRALRFDRACWTTLVTYSASPSETARNGKCKGTDPDRMLTCTWSVDDPQAHLAGMLWGCPKLCVRATTAAMFRTVQPGGAQRCPLRDWLSTSKCGDGVE